MLSLDVQEAYRRRYAAEHAGWRPASHVYYERVAARLTPASRVLDLGCGRGGVMEALHPQAGWVAGVDPDMASLREHRAPGLARVCAPAEALPCADASFDLVCCSWVLEHLAEPGRVFAQVRRVLRPGGWFIFLTPNRRHPLLLANRILGRRSGQLVGRLYGRAQADTFPALYRANTPERISALLEEAGLELVELILVGDPTYLMLRPSLYRLACLLERFTPLAWRVHLVGEARRR